MIEHIDKWCFSTNDEDFQGFFGSREEVIEEAREIYGEGSFSIGRIVHPLDLAPPFADGLIEDLEENLYDQVGGDDQIVELSEACKVELDALIEDFLRQHATFNRFGVSDIELITNPDEGDADESPCLRASVVNPDPSGESK